ncbi:MAG: hypothetical protein BWK76_18060 [Desulfobulbaceae bacterium A2]|nr:MAG: hypothetical protein BWK76_18060 [Desulfobulbaceae bacterium A2]
MILQYPAEMEQLRAMLQQTEQAAAELGVDDQRRLLLVLIAEELIVNIINHAYAATGRGFVRIELQEADANTVRLTIIDQGSAFNPLTREEPDLASGLNERKVGGLGIHLTRQLAEKMTYQRTEDCNVLAIGFRKSA